MSEKTLIVVWLVALGFAPFRLVEAQQAKKVPRVGYLAGSGDANDPGSKAFRQGLEDLGYIEGKNILIEYRYVEAKVDRILSLVAELMQLKVDVFLSGHSRRA